MLRTKTSTCGRFVVIDGLHLDRDVFESLERWARSRELHIQDGIQLALCRLGEQVEGRRSAPAMPSSSSRMKGQPRWLDSE